MPPNFRAGRTVSGVSGDRSMRQDSAHADAALKSRLHAVRVELAQLLAQLPCKHSSLQEQGTSGNPQSAFSQTLSTLTRKEREVLVAFIELLDNKQIAKHLGTKKQTVRNQFASIMGKLGTASREELVALILINAPSFARHEEK